MKPDSTVESITRNLDAAAIAYQERRLEEAAILCAQVLDLERSHAGAHNLMGAIAASAGRYQDAIKHFNTAVKLKPGNVECLQNLSQSFIALDRADDACRVLDQAVSIDPSDVQSLLLRARAGMIRQDFAAAASDYRAAISRDPNHAEAQHGLVAALQRSKLDPDDEQLAEDFSRCLQFDQLEPNLLGPPLARFLSNRHGITGTRFSSTLEQVLADDLFTRALTRLTFIDATMERFLTELRRRVLMACLKAGRVPVDWQASLVGLALHNLRTEFAHFQSAEETDAVQRLDERLQSLTGEDSGTGRLAGPSLLLGLYQNLNDCSSARELEAIPLKDWPEFIQPLIAATFNSAGQGDTGAAIPTLSEAGASSAAVKAMYEENPYPRWERLGGIHTDTAAGHLLAQIPAFKPPVWADQDSAQALIAGCGTGRHALLVAKEFANAEVLAVDISRASLDYAYRKAREYELDNLQFMQADLLDLPQLERKFHMIQTVGTLETLDEPERGWAVLRSLLAPDGLMYVGSYSENARRPVIAAREEIANQGLHGTPKDMRAFRKQVLDGELGQTGKRLTQIGDFYSLSGCRDLLFHVAEKRFTLHELKAIWDRHALDFLGFYPMPAAVLNAYRKRYPDDPHGLTLDNWIAFEQSDSERFGELMGISMFFYWLKAA